ncbi:hypothetical protein KKB18_09195 [bacterium]|nr:hypothetical protein [bacterium]
MVAIDNKIPANFAVNAYQNALNNNVRTRAQIINDNSRLNQTQADRGFEQVNEDNFDVPDFSLPRKSKINNQSHLRELNADTLKANRSSEEKRILDYERNRSLRDMGLGININILI